MAEASKSIENAQRDVNISFVNELALIFDRIGINTYDVLEAAGTKWNFLPFKPGSRWWSLYRGRSLLFSSQSRKPRLSSSSNSFWQAGK